MDFYREWFPHLLLLSVASPYAPEFETGGRSGLEVEALSQSGALLPLKCEVIPISRSN